jgi:glycine cleavage system H lipoate-binding protein
MLISLSQNQSNIKAIQAMKTIETIKAIQLIRNILSGTAVGGNQRE